MLAIFATLFGSAASLGLGALQIGSGLEIVGRLGEVGNGVLVGIIAVLTAALRRSPRSPAWPRASSGSPTSTWCSRSALAAVRVRRRPDGVHARPDPDLDRQPTSRTSRRCRRAPSAEGDDAPAPGCAGWTVFYWAWWLSWTPFVGMFIARISRGRTIRQFVTGVLLVPSLVSLVWFCIFGGAAIDLQQTGTDIAGAGGARGRSCSARSTAYPLATVTSVAGDGPGGDLLRLRRRRGLDRDGLALRAGHARAEQADRDLLGRRHRRRRRGDAAGRWGRRPRPGCRRSPSWRRCRSRWSWSGWPSSLVKDLRHRPDDGAPQYAEDAVEQAVVTGVTEHGDDFALTVETRPGDRRR